MDRLICRLVGHDIWTESDETGPYQHECLRCGWTHPWHGHERPQPWPAPLVEAEASRAA